MAFRVLPISDRTLKGLAKKLERAMNAAHERGAQIIRTEKHTRGYLLFTYEVEPVVVVPVAPVVAQEKRIPAHCMAFMLKVSGLINAQSKAEFVKELPNAVLRAMRQLGPGEARELQQTLEAWYEEHRKDGCKGCDDSNVAGLVVSALKQQLSATIC